MTIKFLKSAKTLQELKSLYFSLAKQLHPDHGGSLEDMQILNNEYDYLKQILPNEQPKTADNSTGKEEKQYKETIFSMDAFRDILNDLLHYSNITIEVIGSWLWISGNGTYAIKDDILKAKYHCQWSKAQKKWYWFNGITEQTWKPKGGFLKSAINRYGITTLNSDPLPELT
jgi:curved DNA-binding protein CbpA